MRGSPWLQRILNVKLDTAWDPGEYQRRSPSRSAGCCLPEGQTRRHSPTKIFGAQHLQGRLHPLPLHLACASAEASTRLLPAVPQGSILGSRLTITQAGFSPARTRGLARPHCPHFPSLRIVGKQALPEEPSEVQRLSYCRGHEARERPSLRMMAWVLPSSNRAVRTLGTRSIMVRRSVMTGLKSGVRTLTELSASSISTL